MESSFSIDNSDFTCFHAVFFRQACRILAKNATSRIKGYLTMKFSMFRATMGK